jgi:RNA polymerase sigma-70 factor, ECF subfamily
VRRSFSGDHTGKETPVPIPNTAVKLSGPMIVPTSAKVGIARFFTKTPPTCESRAGFLLFYSTARRHFKRIFPKIRAHSPECIHTFIIENQFQCSIKHRRSITVTFVHAALSDDQLVRAACRGDVDSFAELFHRHAAMVVGVAYFELSDRGLAEDAAQEAFAEACRNLGKLRDGGKFAYWLATICRRVAGRIRKSNRRYRELPQQEPIAQATPETARIEAVREVVERLPQAAKEVIILRYFSGLSHEEMAKALNTTPAAVHGRLTRAKQQLRQTLTRYGLGVKNP